MSVTVEISNPVRLDASGRPSDLSGQPQVSEVLPGQLATLSEDDGYALVNAGLATFVTAPVPPSRRVLTLPPGGEQGDQLLRDYTAPEGTVWVPPSGDRVYVVDDAGAEQTLPPVTDATIHRLTLSEDCVLTFPPLGPGYGFTLQLVQGYGGNKHVTWPMGTQWGYGSAPPLSTSEGRVDILAFVCLDGLAWTGLMAVPDAR